MGEVDVVLLLPVQGYIVYMSIHWGTHPWPAFSVENETRHLYIVYHFFFGSEQNQSFDAWRARRTNIILYHATKLPFVL